MCTKNADVKIYEPVQEKSGDGADGGEVTGLDADCVIDEISDGSYSEPTGLRLKVGLHLNCLANLFRFRPCVFFANSHTSFFICHHFLCFDTRVSDSVYFFTDPEHKKILLTYVKYRYR